MSCSLMKVLLRVQVKISFFCSKIWPTKFDLYTNQYVMFLEVLGILLYKLVFLKLEKSKVLEYRIPVLTIPD